MAFSIHFFKCRNNFPRPGSLIVHPLYIQGTYPNRDHTRWQVSFAFLFSHGNTNIYVAEKRKAVFLNEAFNGKTITVRLFGVGGVGKKVP
jgi:hypothetical protein